MGATNNRATISSLVLALFQLASPSFLPELSLFIEIVNCLSFFFRNFTGRGAVSCNSTDKTNIFFSFDAHLDIYHAAEFTDYSKIPHGVPIFLLTIPQ